MNFSSSFVTLLVLGTLAASMKAKAIIGGRELGDNNPLLSQSVVAIFDPETEALCTGTLLTKNVLLTAAHCMADVDMRNAFVFFGSPAALATPYRRVVDTRFSPYWNGDGHKALNSGDIALVQFAGDLPVGFKPVLLLNPEAEPLLKNNAQTVLLGYGIDDPVKKTGSGILRAVVVKIANVKYSASEILLDQSSGKGACTGDSGGPAFIYLNKNLYLWGVTSRGPAQKSDCSQFSLYTNALVYRSWINSSLAIMR